MSSENIKDPIIAEGRQVYKMNCQKCHPNGESGVGPEINTIKVPKFMLKARIRSRAFLLWTGRMPQFGKDEIPPKQLNSLVRYIKAMQKNETYR
jgi:mono/diheme cytochrome c family protein